MKNLRIHTKLMVCFGGIIVLMFCIAGFSMSALGKVDHMVAVVADDRLFKVITANEINGAMSDYRVAEEMHVLSTDDARMTAAEAAMRSRKQVIDADLAKLKPLVKLPAAIAALNRLRDYWQQYQNVNSQVLALSRAQRNVESVDLLRGSSSEIFEKASTAAEDFATVQIDAAHAAAGDANNEYARAIVILLVTAGIATAGTIALLTLLIRQIASPLRSMTGAMGELAAGKLDAAVPVEARADEVGDLANAMTAFRDQLHAAEAAKAEQTQVIVASIGAGLEQMAQGDLTARVDAELTGPFAKLKNDFNNAMKAMAETLGAVSQASEGVHTGASEISQASNDLSHRTEQQAASLEETAAAMDQITTTVRESAENASRANKAVAQARSEAEQSGVVVGRAIDAMSGIERASNEISEIITVIDGIAFQTNLLALNAGVEAARAGDAGKGFAVVASEVRALAQRSADAAKDVKARITASSEQVDAGVALVSETGKALDRIITSIGEVDGLVGEIATSAEHQASGLQQVNAAVAEMDGVTQQNAAMVEEATAAARSLAAEADELARNIGRFRLGDGEKHPAPAANNVHDLQARAGNAAKRIARPSRGRTAAAVAPAEDDWSQF